MKRRFFAPLCALMLLAGCAAAPAAQSTPPPAEAWAERQPISSMELRYAEQFAVDYYADGSALVTVAGTERFLLLPEGMDVPADLPADITPLPGPLDSIYLAASSAMDFFRELGALDAVRLTATDRGEWSLPEVTEALDSGTMLYAGRYAAPDYELLVEEGADIAIESTMIWHSPETAEQLGALGIPVLVERSSYEPHPLGRVEWIKLYGLLTGKAAEAEAFFETQLTALADVLDAPAPGSDAPAVAFFYIANGGYANVRKPGDYISRMIEMAGGRYVPGGESAAEDNALSTMNMQMEAFYAAARDADILIYNSAVDGELQTLDELLQKSELLADFKAVQNGNVWCTGKNVFQQATAIGPLLADLHAVISGTVGDGSELAYLHRLT